VIIVIRSATLDNERYVYGKGIVELVTVLLLYQLYVPAAEFLSKVGPQSPAFQYRRIAFNKLRRKRFLIHLPFVFNIEGMFKNFYRWKSADYTKLLKMKPTKIPPIENNEYLPPPYSIHSLHYYYTENSHFYRKLAYT
jgi:hypothetical protein